MTRHEKMAREITRNELELTERGAGWVKLSRESVWEMHERIVSALDQVEREKQAEVDRLRSRIEQLEKALTFYGQEQLYDMQSYFTAATLHAADELPRNVEVAGNPIVNDRGKIARRALLPREGDK